MRVALSFDDGPHPEWTPPILDLLAEHNAKATFFVCGAHILGNIGLIDRIHDEGHEIGNHTTNHPDLSTLTEEQVRAEIAETQAMVHAITGTMPQLWRAPYLRLPSPMPEWPTHLGADVIPGDWQEWRFGVIAEKVVDGLDDGCIVLLHDGRPVDQPPFADGGSLDTRQQTVNAVRWILEHVADSAVEFVTASALMEGATSVH